jgi:GT2 family glycosyltransferase
MDRTSNLGSTAVVVLTRNRKDLLRAVLLDVSTWGTGGIIVVENAGTDGTLEMIEHEFPDVIRVASAVNLGATGGRNLGLARAQELGFELVFLAEDDTTSNRAALTGALEVMGARPNAVLVGPSGGTFRHGRIRWGRYRGSSEAGGRVVQECDFVHLDSCLVRLDHPAASGWMRADFFIMFEEQEWGFRIRRLGGEVLCLPIDIDRMHVGAGSSTGAYPWRAYYQTRNHLRFCLDASSPALWFGFVLRVTHQLLREVAGGRWPTIRLRVRALRDARAGRMGLQVAPA